MALHTKDFVLESEDFKVGERLDFRFTCDGENKPPRLTWFNVPEDTETYALICDDPDASPGTFVHWVVYNVPVERSNLDHIGDRTEKLLDGTLQGKNSYSKIGYDGPCPPKDDQEHRYYFKVYALDNTLSLKPGATKEEVEKAMKGHVLAVAELVGTYKRK
jgi:Raf kinase inhibitor-like YbhB/YbcL family protein